MARTDPNIVQYRGFIKTTEFLYIILECVSSLPIHSLLLTTHVQILRKRIAPDNAQEVRTISRIPRLPVYFPSPSRTLVPPRPGCDPSRYQGWEYIGYQRRWHQVSVIPSLPPYPELTDSRQWQTLASQPARGDPPPPQSSDLPTGCRPNPSLKLPSPLPPTSGPSAPSSSSSSPVLLPTHLLTLSQHSGGS